MRLSGSDSSGRRPRILIDAIAYSPRDGGFTTAMHDLLNTCGKLQEFEFVVVHARKHRSVFQAFGLTRYSVAIPRSLRFFASLFLLPFVAHRTGASAVHCEISALPWFLGVPGSATVNDLYFLMDPEAGGRTLRQRIMRLYWERVFVASIRHARVLKTISETTIHDLRRLVSGNLSVVRCDPPVVAPDGSQTIRRPPGPAEDLRVLFVGSVVPRRNLPFLLRALQLVRRPWRLDVVGNMWWGADELGSMPNDERVQFHGYVSRQTREKLMAEAHLLVAPSRYEGFGYPTAEAMVRGLPVLASDVSAFREFVPSDWRFPLDDPRTLASMIDGLDEQRLASMSGTARDAVRRFSSENHLDSHRRLFDRLVSRTRSTRESPSCGSVWQPGMLDRARALGRRTLISILGREAEGRLRAAYHAVLRRADRFGLPEDETTKAVLAAIAARSRTVCDVGANVGRYAWFLKRHASTTCRLFALEPHPAAAQLLRSNVGPSSQCTVLEVAAADRDGTAELVVPEGPFGAPLSALAWMRNGKVGGEDVRTLRIAARRIDSMVADGTMTVASPLFMKIDVEGAEASVLRGATELLRRHQPIIYFECQAESAERQGETPQQVWDKLHRAGYRIFANASGKFVQVDRIQSQLTNYLAVPAVDSRGAEGSMDADAVIAVIDRWATRTAEA